MMVPVQSEHGVQYVPYDPYNSGAYLMAYMPQAMYGMTVQGYPSYAQAWGVEEDAAATSGADGKSSKKRGGKKKAGAQDLSADLGAELAMPETLDDEVDGGMRAWDQSAYFGGLA